MSETATTPAPTKPARAKTEPPRPVAGRIVVYQEGVYEATAAGGGRNHAPETYPAMIVRVREDGTVNLQVFFDGVVQARMRVPYGAEVEPEVGCWRWPELV